MNDIFLQILISNLGIILSNFQLSLEICHNGIFLFKHRISQLQQKKNQQRKEPQPVLIRVLNLETFSLFVFEDLILTLKLVIHFYHLLHVLQHFYTHNPT